jgi:hypothetical protein
LKDTASLWPFLEKLSNGMKPAIELANGLAQKVAKGYDAGFLQFSC